MAVTIQNTRIQIKRDNDFNYAAHPDFLPLKGEICLVDTAANGLRVKVGDGVTLFADLDWYYPLDAMSTTKLNLGYYSNGNFYKDAAHTQLIIPDEDDLYIDKLDNIVYFFDGDTNNYVCASSKIELATEETPGIVKLYKETGENEDGSMT